MHKFPFSTLRCYQLFVGNPSSKSKRSSCVVTARVKSGSFPECNGEINLLHWYLEAITLVKSVLKWESERLTFNFPKSSFQGVIHYSDLQINVQPVILVTLEKWNFRWARDWSTGGTELSYIWMALQPTSTGLILWGLVCLQWLVELTCRLEGKDGQKF